DYGFQYYYPMIGRWTSIDLVADWAPDITPFRYGFNNPILYTDPDGLFESRDEAKQHKRSNDLKGRIKKNKQSGEFEIHLKGSDGRVSKSSETGEIEYAAVASYTGPSIQAYEPNRWERFQNANFFTGIAYGSLNDAWLTTQRFNPFDTHTTHLAGHYA
ncbi:hypothetical protein RZS08_26010, partial [Arthrospira platensis SPKY1]|nr:hypothetical protein [Arthrospira platensis SPKY1]